MEKEFPVFDNHDHRIKYYKLLLKRDNLDSLTEYKLPDGYRFVFYKSGDHGEWIEIKKSAKEFEPYDQGLESWNRYYKGKDDELVNRMVFIENENGEKVATVPTFYDIYDRDISGAGCFIW